MSGGKKKTSKKTAAGKRRESSAAPSPPPRDELIRLAEQLNLTTLAARLPTLLQAVEDEQPTYAAFVSQLLRTEALARDERRQTRALHRSQLGSVEGLDGYDFSCRPGLDARIVLGLLDCAWVAEARPIVCAGRTGTGKTRILKALGRAACLAGYQVLYKITADMLDELRAARVDGTYRRVLRRYTKPAVLLLDEFGHRRFDDEATDDLFRVVSARYTKASTVVAANTGFKRWSEFFPSYAHALATVDRLVDQATLLRFSGPSWRGPREIHGDKLEDEAA